MENKNNPYVQDILNSGTRSKIVSSFMDKIPNIFSSEKKYNVDEIKMLGYINNSRQYRYINRKYVKWNEYLDSYKMFVPEANGSGAYGEVLAEPLVGKPGEGSADTFLNAGPFNTYFVAESLIKYYKSRFFRSLLGVRKVTHHSPSQVWMSIPLQDFTPSADIDWSQSVGDIDRQLYRKYKLDDEEVEFIESHVKEMG